MKYYKRILERTSGTGIIMKQDILIMLFPILVKSDYTSMFKSMIREILENNRSNVDRLRQLSSVLILGIKYHLLDSSFIKSDLVTELYSGELESIKIMMEDVCIVVQSNRVQTSRYSVMLDSVRHDSHKTISPESMAQYLVYRFESCLSAIKHTEFLDAILDEGRNPGRYPNFTSMSSYTNDVSRFVSNCRDIQYFVSVLKVLTSMKNYHVVATVIAGLGEIPKKYVEYIKMLSNIVMSPTYDVFISRIGGKSKSTGCIPFLGTIITDIKHAIENMYIDGKSLSKPNKNQWNTLQYIHKLVQLFRCINGGTNSLIDYSIDQYFNRVLDDLYIYSRKIYEWTVSDCCQFIKNLLITETVLYDIDSIVSKIEQQHIDGKTLEMMTVDDLDNIGLIRKVSSRIVSRIESYNSTVYNYTDSVHDMCMLLKDKGLDHYCKTFAHHQILPSMIQYLTDDDYEYMTVKNSDIDTIRNLLQ